MPEVPVTRAESPADASVVEALQRAAFGPGAYSRAAFRVREQASHDRSLSFVTESNGKLIASVRLTPISIGGRPGLLLGPLVVDPCCKNLGHGKALLRRALDAAAQAGWRYVMLVGDEPYYGPFGFKRLRSKQVSLPGPVDPERLLVNELTPGAAADLAGMVVGAPRD